MEGELVDPIEFMAVRKKFGNTFFLVNTAFASSNTLKEIPEFDKVLWPTLKNLEYEDQYKTLQQTQNRIKEVSTILESGKVPKEQQSEKNILDYKREIYFLRLLETKFEYPKSRFIQRTNTGIPVLTYVRSGNVPLSLGYNINKRLIYVPTDQHIQTHSTRKNEIDYNFPLKKPSKINFKNAVTLFMLLLCAFFIWGIYDNKATAGEIQSKLIICEEQKASLNSKWANSNEQQATKIGTAIDKLANLETQRSQNAQQEANTPPPNVK
jgi:hypothetical protein